MQLNYKIYIIFLFIILFYLYFHKKKEINKIKKYNIRESFDNNCQKIIPHVFKIKFLKPNFCKKLINNYDKYFNKNITFNNKNFNKFFDDDDTELKLGMTCYLNLNKKFDKILKNKIKKNIFPIAKKYFPYYNPTKISPPYLLKYDATKKNKNKMKIHIDSEQLAVIVYLNDNFTGGGTYFPTYKKLIKGNIGDAILYPGGITHPHSGVKITSGVRYLLLFSLIDENL
jgi:hypothetical protein